MPAGECTLGKTFGVAVAIRIVRVLSIHIKNEERLSDMAKNTWVTRHDDGWAVKKEGAERASSIHRTQAAAIKAATPKARNTGGDVIIQGRDGKIRDRDSYGNDPCPPKDTKH